MSATTEIRPLLTGPRKAVLAGGIGLGVAALLYAYYGGGKDSVLRFWQAYLVNWIFWTAMSQGGVVVAAILEVTHSSWGRPMKRIAEAFGSFLPVSFVLYLLILPGMAILYPWVNDPLPGSRWWLSRDFVFTRDMIALGLLYILSLIFMYCSIRPDARAGESEIKKGAGLLKWLGRGWRGDQEEIERGVVARRRLAPALIIAYSFVYSLVAYDLVMSLDPTWYSTLFGAYLAIISLFGALAMIAAVSVLMRNRASMMEAMGEPQFHDMGKLMFGFCLLSLDMFWSQFLIIWYGNLPEETGYLLVRAFAKPWETLTWVVLFGGFVAPFILLLRRGMKSKPRKLLAISLWIMVMIWLERFLLVAPSTWKGHSLPLGVMEIMMTAGFGAIFFLCFAALMDRVPELPVTDPIFTGVPAHHHVLGEPEKM